MGTENLAKAQEAFSQAKQVESSVAARTSTAATVGRVSPHRLYAAPLTVRLKVGPLPCGWLRAASVAESETDRREAVRLEGDLGLLRQERDAHAEQRAKLSREIDQLREQIRREKQRTHNCLLPCVDIHVHTSAEPSIGTACRSSLGRVVRRRRCAEAAKGTGHLGVPARRRPVSGAPGSDVCQADRCASFFFFLAVIGAMQHRPALEH